MVNGRGRAREKSSVISVRFSLSPRDGGSSRDSVGDGDGLALRRYGHLRVVQGVKGIAGKAVGLKGKPALETGRSDP